MAVWNRVIFAVLLAVLLPIEVSADTKLGGYSWASDSIVEGTEKLVIKFDFYNESDMKMTFVTNNTIPNFGRCKSSISVKGTYVQEGALFHSEIDNSTMVVKIDELKIFNLKTDAKTQAMVETQMKSIIKAQAVKMFADFTSVSLVYVHGLTPKEFSLIWGDVNDFLEIRFTQQGEIAGNP
ncbi:MAG: hypothetical protein ACI4AH_00795 [Muribaculaceae bacterium]